MDTAATTPRPTPAACPRCGAPLPTAADATTATPPHCPACLLDLAMAPAAEPAGRGPALPPIAELEPMFPDYTLEALVGRGGMGAVYRARHKKLDRLVAIKLLLPDLVGDPSFAERFEGEARTMAKLSHPGIVGLFDFGRSGPWFFLVMEYVDGANLRELLAQGNLRPQEVLGYVGQLCDALQYAHDHRIVHRDIKPENILVDGDGRVRIADFGLAKLVGTGSNAVPLTQSNQQLGTPLYMAPEQVHAAAGVDHRADLYSLGVVVYEMLTGRLPLGRFQPPSARDAAAKPFDPVVMKSLESDPAQRYQAAREVKRDLQQRSDDAARRGAGEATAHPALVRSDAAPRPWRVPLAALLCLALVLVAQWMPWLIVANAFDLQPTGAWSVFRIRYHDVSSKQINDAWHASVHRLPLFLTLFAAVVAALAAMLRERAHRFAGAAQRTALAAGLGLCGLTVLTCWLTAGLTAGSGVYVALLAFAAAMGLCLWQRRRIP
jgi:tRNA A-37 threonylcarbamoyl transferase component Bud32